MLEQGLVRASTRAPGSADRTLHTCQARPRRDGADLGEAVTAEQIVGTTIRPVSVADGERVDTGHPRSRLQDRLDHASFPAVEGLEQRRRLGQWTVMGDDAARVGACGHYQVT